MLKLTFNFHGALSILTLLKMSSPYSPRKSQRKKKGKKIEVKRGERKERQKREKTFCLSSHVRKVNFKWPFENLSFDTSLHKLILMVLILRP